MIRFIENAKTPRENFDTRDCCVMATQYNPVDNPPTPVIVERGFLTRAGSLAYLLSEKFRNPDQLQLLIAVYWSRWPREEPCKLQEVLLSECREPNDV